MKKVRTHLLFALALVVLLLGQGVAQAECKGEKIDPSWNRNDNKPGTACHRQVAKVRKLEFHPDFECNKSLRQEWARELKIAEQMGCVL